MMESTRTGRLLRAFIFLAGVFVLLLSGQPAAGQDGGAAPPSQPVKLVFIHHSCGENWLTDGHGDLGLTLGENNYFVSDTNYGWGPHGIGDRTDILDWPEWFRSPGSAEILQALYSESGQHSSYTRTLPDPGGENTIIMFKSCFPNSALEGAPGDPPSGDDWLTVGSAKRVYNDLLNYFITRPDKLFVVITAPPLQETTHAANARAFNTWLVQDWLKENEYPYSNVAVWDFYNVLTHPDNHHRYENGAVEYVTSAGADVLYYPDNGDTHPSPEGNRKAAGEFVGMLNYFYNRWQLQAPTDVAVEPGNEVEETGAAEPEAQQPSLDAGVIDTFEGDAPEGSYGWEAFYDPEGETWLECGPSAENSISGSRSLHIRYDIGPGSWGTCGLMYPAEQDWSSAEGLAFKAAGTGSTAVNLDVYTGPEDSRASYVYSFYVSDEDQAVFTVRWDQLSRVAWEADDAPFDPESVSGLAFGFEGLEDGRVEGDLWIDDLTLGSEAPDESPAGENPAAEDAPEEEPEVDIRSLCPLSMGLIFLPAAAAWIMRR